MQTIKYGFLLLPMLTFPSDRPILGHSLVIELKLKKQRARDNYAANQCLD